MEDEGPPNLYGEPLWWFDGKNVGLGFYISDGVWETLGAHDTVTHWSWAFVPPPPEEPADLSKFHTCKGYRHSPAFMPITTDPEGNGWLAIIPGGTEDQSKWSWMCPSCADRWRMLAEKKRAKKLEASVP
jgi:hypothetical protein